MSSRIVRLGTPKHRGEGMRLGTVRHPPRGVSKARYAFENWFDVWLPNLSPSRDLLKSAHNWNIKDHKGWERFARQYEVEMSAPENSRLLDALAALSQAANFSVCC